jgi:hypothetical protein
VTQKEKAAAYDRLIAHLRWTFNYHAERLPQERAERAEHRQRYYDHNVHAAATALLIVDALGGVCPCDYCDGERKRESEGNSRKSEGNLKREKPEAER